MKETHLQSQPLKDIVAIVTGASSGIGEATAWEVARRGAHVVLAARRAEKLAALATELTAAGHCALALPTDVSDSTQVHHLVTQTLDHCGHVDALINCAGMGWLTPLAESSEEDVLKVVSVNLLSSMLLTRATLPHLLKQQHGSLIFVASVSGYIAIDPLYSATKFGVRGFALALHRELHKTGIATSLVSPGFIRTSMSAHMRVPMPGPEVVARLIADLLVHPRREVVIPRYYHGLIWIEHLIPWLADRAIRRGRTNIVEPG